MSFEKYGWEWEDGTDEGTIELRAFRGDGPLGRYEHLKRAVDAIWNKYEAGSYYWNAWSESLLRTFCEEEWVVVSGPGASSKTCSAAMYGICRWYSSPRDTAVLFTSTTLDGLRKRVWGEVSKYWRKRPAIGNAVQSRNCIQWEKGVDAAGLYGIACDKGEVEKAIGKIIGFHRVRKLIVIVDEMPYTPESIVEACVNLESGKEFFQFIGLGNAADQLDPHGRMSEPIGGWDSVSEESEWWKTKRGVCVHLDGLRSPNVLEGRDKYPGILTQKNIDTTIELYGAESPQFWQMRRGYWAPEGVSRTVLSMPMIVRGRAQEVAVFDRDFVIGAGLDPAFEGEDRCVLRFFKCGNENGVKVLSLGEMVFIKTKALTGEPVHYQIVRQVKEECVKRGVNAYMFALDATGEGGGLASIFQREWSPEIMMVEFGGRPGKEAVSQTNAKRCDEEYDRMVTSLWFWFRLLVQNEQVRGLDQESATEFCRRYYEMKGKYISIETKAKMKERTRKSPDLADACVIGAELMKKRGGLKLAKVKYEEGSVKRSWTEFQRKRSLESAYEMASFQ